MPPKKGGQISSFTFLMQHYRLIAKDRQLVEIKEVGEKDEELKTALCEDSVDAVFHVRAMGNQAIRELLTDESCQTQLVPMSRDSARLRRHSQTSGSSLG